MPDEKLKQILTDAHSKGATKEQLDVIVERYEAKYGKVTSNLNTQQNQKGVSAGTGGGSPSVSANGNSSLESKPLKEFKLSGSSQQRKNEADKQNLQNQINKPKVGQEVVIQTESPLDIQRKQKYAEDEKKTSIAIDNVKRKADKNNVVNETFQVSKEDVKILNPYLSDDEAEIEANRVTQQKLQDFIAENKLVQSNGMDAFLPSEAGTSSEYRSTLFEDVFKPSSSIMDDLGVTGLIEKGYNIAKGLNETQKNPIGKWATQTGIEMGERFLSEKNMLSAEEIEQLNTPEFKEFLVKSGWEERYQKTGVFGNSKFNDQKDQVKIVGEFYAWKADKKANDFAVKKAEMDLSIMNGDFDLAKKQQDELIQLNSEFQEVGKEFNNVVMPKFKTIYDQQQKAISDRQEYVKASENLKSGNVNLDDIGVVAQQNSEKILNTTKNIFLKTASGMIDLLGSNLMKPIDAIFDTGHEKAIKELSDFVVDDIVRATEIKPESIKVGFTSESKVYNYNGKQYVERNDGFVYDENNNIQQNGDLIKEKGQFVDSRIEIDPFNLIGTGIEQVAQMYTAFRTGKFLGGNVAQKEGTAIAFGLMSYKDNVAQIKDAFPDVTNDEATVYGMIMSSLDGLAENLIGESRYFEAKPASWIIQTLKNEGKKPTKDAITAAGKEWFKGSFGEYLEEEIVMQGGRLVNAAFNEVMSGDALDTEISTEEALETRILGFGLGAVMNVPIAIATYKGQTQALDLDVAAFNVAMNEGAYIKMIETLKNETISQEVGKEKIEEFNQKMHEVIRYKKRLPDNVTFKEFNEYKPLLDERDKLEERKKELDPVFRGEIDEQIAKIDESISNVRQSKKKEDWGRNSTTNKRIESVDNESKSSETNSIKTEEKPTQVKTSSLKKDSVEKSKNYQTIISKVQSGKSDIETEIEVQNEILSEQKEVFGEDSEQVKQTNQIISELEEYKTTITKVGNKSVRIGDEGSVIVQNNNGKEISYPQRREVVLQALEAGAFDSIENSLTEDVQLNSGEEISRYIADNSLNPIEIAEEIENLKSNNSESKDLNDFESTLVSHIRQGVSEDSFIQNSDKNNLSPSIRKSYLSKNGRPLDQIAQEVEFELYGDYNANQPRVTEQMIVDFILDNPSISVYEITRKSDEQISLENKFTEITGLPASPQNIRAFSERIKSGNKGKFTSNDTEPQQRNQNEEVNLPLETNDEIDWNTLSSDADLDFQIFGSNNGFKIDDDYSVRVKVYDDGDVTAELFYQGLRVGHLATKRTLIKSENGTDKIGLEVDYVSIDPKHRGKGLSKNLYFGIINHSPQGYEYLLSDKRKRVNKKEVPILWENIKDGNSDSYDFVKLKGGNTDKVAYTENGKILIKDSETNPQGRFQKVSNENFKKLIRRINKAFPKVGIELIKDKDLSKIIGNDWNKVTTQAYRNKINSDFNEQLKDLKSGTLKKGHVFSLGNPSSILKASGIPNLPIELSASRLTDKSMQENHPFDLSEIENLPDAIQNPLAVFDSSTVQGSFVVLTELTKGNKNFIAAIEVNRNDGKIQVNSVRSVYPRNSTQIASAINENLTKYVDKQKMREWFSKQQFNSADVKGQFSRASNIVRNFENPISDNDIQAQVEEFRDAHTAPSMMGYENVDEALEDGYDVNLAEVVTDRHNAPQDFFSSEQYANRMFSYAFASESLKSLFDVKRKITNGSDTKSSTVKIYRAVPKNVNINKLISNDWVSLSKGYAEYHGESRFGENEYKIIEQEVPIAHVWWDHNDINEWGYDPTNEVRFLHDKDQRVYGFVKDGKVYINEDSGLNYNTPIHEFGHVWLNMLKVTNEKLFQIGISSVKNTKYHNQVKRNSAYKGLSEERILEEALATAIGDKGERFVTDLQKSRFKRFLNWLKDEISSLFGRSQFINQRKNIEKLSLNKFLDGAIGDILGGVEIVPSNPELDKQIKSINLTYDKNGKHLAPNGKPSNLTEEQAKLVRSENFKKWFGDWENDPENSSKILDENGEPKIVYRGGERTTQFREVPGKGKRDIDFGIFFADTLKAAKDFTKDWKYKDVEHIGVFLNVKKPFIIDVSKIEIGDKYAEHLAGEELLRGKNLGWEEEMYIKIFQDAYSTPGTDGVVFLNTIDPTPQDTYIAFKANQIKLADGSNKTFSLDNNDIRFSIGSRVNNILNSKNFKGRDLTLGLKADTKANNEKIDKVIRLWNNTFKSGSGLPVKLHEIIKGMDRQEAVILDVLKRESSQLKKLLKNATKGDTQSKFNAKASIINRYISGENVDISFLNSDQIQELEFYRARIDNLSNNILEVLNKKVVSMEKKLESYKEGTLPYESIANSLDKTKGLIYTINKNKGKYITRSYEAFTNKKYIERLTVPLHKMSPVNQEKIRKAEQFLVKEEGYSANEARKYIAEYLDDIKRAADAGDFITSSTGRANAPFLKKRNDLPLEFRNLLGEAKEPLYNYVNTVYGMSNYLAKLNYQDQLRDNLISSKIGTYEPQSGYTRLVSDAPEWATLNGIYVPNEIKQAMDDLQPEGIIKEEGLFAGFIKLWVAYTAFTKVGKTVWSPTTTSRNLISGVFLGLNGGHFFAAHPKYTIDAFNQAFETKGSISTEKARNERNKLISLGIINDGVNSGELRATLNDFRKSLDRLVKSNVAENTVESVNKLYAFGDDFYKVIGFYSERDRFMKHGMSEGEAEAKAAERIRGGYPTYSYLPKNMKALRRIPLVGTFVSFPYEAVRSTKNNLLYIAEDLSEGRNDMAAKRLMGMMVANGLASTLALITRSLIAGWDDDDENAMRDMLPEYQTNSLLIYTGKTEGEPTFIDATALFPSEVYIKSIATLFGNRKRYDNIGQNIYNAVDQTISPYTDWDIASKTAVDLLYANKDGFGQPIYKSENFTDAVLTEPEKVSNFFLKQAGPGVYNNIAEFARANDVAPEFFGEKVTSYGREYNNQDALFALFGFRFSTINYGAGSMSLGYKIKDEASNIRYEVSKDVKSNNVMSDDEVKSVISNYSKEYDKKVSEKITQIIDSGKKLGMDEDRLNRAILASTNISKNDWSFFKKYGKLPLKVVSDKTESNYLEKTNIVNQGNEKEQKLTKAFLENRAKVNAAIKEYNLRLVGK